MNGHLMAGVVLLAIASIAKAEQFYNWKVSFPVSAGYSDPNAPVPADLTAYLVDASVIGQGDFLTALRARNASALDKRIAGADSLTTSIGQVAAKSFSYDGGHEVGTDWDAYFALMASGADGETYVFLSELLGAQSLGINSEITFNEAKVGNSTVNYGTAAFSGSGWYGGVVPEPSSGLLLLLGIAALSLRRRKAEGRCA